MLNAIITWSLGHRFLVIIFTLLLIVGGLYSLSRLPIDAFPDTDPIQYCIFSQVFGGERGPLFLIGDPKQAIYAFRGARFQNMFDFIEAFPEAEVVGMWFSSGVATREAEMGQTGPAPTVSVPAGTRLVKALEETVSMCCTAAAATPGVPRAGSSSNPVSRIP